MASRKTLIEKPCGIRDSWGGRRDVDKLFVVEMGPEDLPEIDQPDWESPANRGRTKQRAERDFEDEDSYWGHIRSVAHLEEVIREGWEEGSAKVAKLADQIYDKIPVPLGARRKVRWMAQGDEVEMTKVFGGQLDQAWRSAPRQRGVAPRVISLDVNVGHNCHVSADDLFWAGAAGAALTDALEQAGYRVELYSTSCSLNGYGRTGGHAELTRFRAKAAGEPLSPPAVAALMALPATFRWFHLQSWTAAPWQIDGGYGHAANVDDALNHALENNVIEGSEFQLQNVLSEKAAIAEIERVLKVIEDEQWAGTGVMI